MRARRGFSLLELVATLVIVMGLIGIALPTYKALKGRGSDSNVTMRLAALQLEVDRLAGDYPGAVLPANLDRFLRHAGATFTTEASNADTRISVALVAAEPERAVLAALAPSNTCFVAITSPDADMVWAKAANVAKGKCKASLVTATAVTGTREQPTPITLT